MNKSVPGLNKETFTLRELLKRSADSALSIQNADGSFPAGENYAYTDPETPVRNTSRWAAVFCRVYELTEDDRFRDAAEDAIDFLLDDDLRQQGHTFHCRKTTNKDRCNGLVGQATPIRALTLAGEVLDREDAINTATEVFKLHPFDADLGLWERIEIDGRNLSFDRTLNHQIIFAARSAPLANHDDAVAERLIEFLDVLNSNMALHSDGLIKHYIHPPISSVAPKLLDQPKKYPLLWNAIVNPIHARSKKRRRKELGYHPVNLSALAQLHTEIDEHPFWESDKFHATIRCLEEQIPRLLSGEDLVHGSTMPGTDIASALYEFVGAQFDEIKYLIEHDLDRLLDRSSYLLESSQIDSNDQAALVVRLLDLPDGTVSVAPDD